MGPALRRLTIPMLFGILAVMIFNVADTLFAAKLGTSELAAMSFTFPVVALISSVAMGLGIGTTAVVAAAIGAGHTARVRELARDGLILAVVIVAVLAGIGVATITPLFRLLGASDALIPLIREYMIIWYPGMVFLVVPMVGNAAIRAAGDARTPAAIMMSSALLNLALDPVLMFGLGPIPALGLQGAAIASVISRAFTLVLALRAMIWQERMVATSLPAWRPLWQNWKEYGAISIPAAATNLLIPATAAIVTALIASHGPEAVAAYGAGTRIEMLIMMVPMALSASLTPFIGQNWGAGAMLRVRASVAMSQRFVAVWGMLGWLALALLAAPVAALFSDNAAVQQGLTLYIRVALVGLFGEGILMVASSALSGMQKPMRAAGLTILRMAGFLIPAVFAGSQLAGITGAFSGIAFANIAAGAVAVFWLRRLDTPASAPAPAATGAELLAPVAKAALLRSESSPAAG